MPTKHRARREPTVEQWAERIERGWQRQPVGRESILELLIRAGRQRDRRAVRLVRQVADDPRRAQTPFGIAGTDHSSDNMRCYLEGVRDAARYLEGAILGPRRKGKV